jgi:small neutral amino acid transporter SnatA (MarC family)
MREGIIAEVLVADRARLEALAADRIIRWIGPAILQIIMRVAGILLLALAVQLGLSALRDLGALAPLPIAGHWE